MPNIVRIFLYKISIPLRWREVIEKNISKVKCIKSYSLLSSFASFTIFGLAVIANSTLRF